MWPTSPFQLLICYFLVSDRFPENTVRMHAVFPGGHADEHQAIPISLQLPQGANELSPNSLYRNRMRCEKKPSMTKEAPAFWHPFVLLFCIQNDGNHTKRSIMIPGIIPKRAANSAIHGVPLSIVKAPGFIAPLQQLHLKSGLYKYLRKSMVIIHDFMGKSRMIWIPIPADLNHILVPCISEVPVRNSNTQIAAICKIIIAVLGCLTSFFKSHMLPDMLSEESSWAFNTKQPFKIRSA